MVSLVQKQEGTLIPDKMDEVHYTLSLPLNVAMRLGKNARKSYLRTLKSKW